MRIGNWVVTQQGFWGRAKPVVVILIALLIGSYISGRFALHLVSLIDTTRLVPMSGGDVLRAVPLAFLLYVLGIGAVIRFRIRHSLEWFSLLYAIRMTAALLLTMIFQVDDEVGFHYAGMEQVYGIFSFGGGRAYYHMVNTLYSIFGPNILLPKMFNVFLGSLLPFLAFDITYWLFQDRKAAWRAFWVTGFLPPFVYFSAVNLKEMATGFLFVLLVWVLANPKGGYLRRLLSSGACIVVLYWLRGAPWTIIAIAGVIAYIILGETWRLRHLLQLRLWLKVTLVVALSILFFWPFLIEPAKQMALSRMTQETHFIERFTESKATVMKFVEVSNPLSPRNLGVLFLRGLFAPSPLRFLLDYNLGTIIEAFNMLVWYLLFPFAVMGFLAERQKGAVVACGLVVIGVLNLATMGIMVGSDPYRHRMVAMGLVAILAATGLKKANVRHYRWVMALWVLGALGFTFLWLALRVVG